MPGTLRSRWNEFIKNQKSKTCRRAPANGTHGNGTVTVWRRRLTVKYGYGVQPYNLVKRPGTVDNVWNVDQGNIGQNGKQKKRWFMVRIRKMENQGKMRRQRVWQFKCEIFFADHFRSHWRCSLIYRFCGYNGIKSTWSWQKANLLA